MSKFWKYRTAPGAPRDLTNPPHFDMTRIGHNFGFRRRLDRESAGGTPLRGPNLAIELSIVLN
jgi:hypothetical protein